MAVGLYLTSSQTAIYSAAAQLVVDPAATVVSEGASVSPPDRYITVQVVVLRSPKVAERAAELAKDEAGESAPGQIPTAEEFLTNAEIFASEGTDLIEIGFEAETPGGAILGANSLANAYQDVRKTEAIATATAAIARVDALIVSAEDEIESIQNDIDLQRAGGSQEQEAVIEALGRQMATALNRLGELQDVLTETTDPAEAADIRQRIADISQQISMFQVVRDLSQEDPNLTALLQTQQAAINRRAQLSERRDILAVDVELVSSGVTSFLPATSARALGGTNLARTALVMGVFGALIGAGLAYILATTRRRTFAHRNAPEAVLEAPLLADIPDFAQERLSGVVPVRTDPNSVSAESFRFALAALDLQLGNIGAKSTVLVSAGIGAGKTIVAANTALAAVREGYRVLVVDADFGNQALTELLTGSSDPTLGLTEAVYGMLGQVIQEIPLVGGSLWLLSRGNRPTNAVDFFRAEATFDLFDELRERFDLVLIDSPSMLQVAYGTLVARHADSVIAVVSHGDPTSELEELADRLRLIGKPIAGYIYNRAPLRPQMTVSEGSLRELNQPHGAEFDRGRHSDV
ncbi:MAG: hypothetical protein WED83_01440 [Acidimicrobiia bacterium]